MALAIHTGKQKAMSYSAKDLEHSSWPFYLAFKVVGQHPKFARPPSGGDELLEFTRSHEGGDSGNRERYEIEDSCKNTLTFNDARTNIPGKVESTDEKTPVPAALRAARAGNIGRKATKHQRKLETVATQASINASSIAKSMRENIVLMEERNAMRAFTAEACMTDEGKKERAEYFPLMRRTYLRRARERISDGKEELSHEKGSSSGVIESDDLN